MALETWIWDGMDFPTVTFASTAFWWLVTFFLTVLNEKAVLRRRWKAREIQPKLSAAAISWRCNAVTYTGLLLVLGGTILYALFDQTVT